MSKNLNFIILLSILFLIGMALYLSREHAHTKPEPFEGYYDVVNSEEYQAIPEETLIKLEEAIERDLGISYARYLYCQDNLLVCSESTYNPENREVIGHDNQLKDLIDLAGYSQLYTGLNTYKIDEFVTDLDTQKYVYDRREDTEPEEIYIETILNLDNLENSYNLTVKDGTINGIFLSRDNLDEEFRSDFDTYYTRISTDLGASEVILSAEFNPNINNEIKIYPSRGMAILDHNEFRKKIYVFSPRLMFEEKLAQRLISFTFPLIMPPVGDFEHSSH